MKVTFLFEFMFSVHVEPLNESQPLALTPVTLATRRIVPNAKYVPHETVVLVLGWEQFTADISGDVTV